MTGEWVNFKSMSSPACEGGIVVEIGNEGSMDALNPIVNVAVPAVDAISVILGTGSACSGLID